MLGDFVVTASVTPDRRRAPRPARRDDTPVRRPSTSVRRLSTKQATSATRKPSAEIFRHAAPRKAVKGGTMYVAVHIGRRRGGLRSVNNHSTTRERIENATAPGRVLARKSPSHAACDPIPADGRGSPCHFRPGPRLDCIDCAVRWGSMVRRLVQRRTARRGGDRRRCRRDRGDASPLPTDSPATGDPEDKMDAPAMTPARMALTAAELQARTVLVELNRSRSVLHDMHAAGSLPQRGTRCRGAVSHRRSRHRANPAAQGRHALSRGRPFHFPLRDPVGFLQDRSR